MALGIVGLLTRLDDAVIVSDEHQDPLPLRRKLFAHRLAQSQARARRTRHRSQSGQSPLICAKAEVVNELPH
jgi:hypothetical protein